MDRKESRKLNREWIGILLLGVLLVSGIGVSVLTHRQSSTLARTLDAAAGAALSEDWETAAQGYASARQDWQKRWKLLAVLADHAALEEIDDLFTQLGVHSAARDRREFAVICAQLAGRIRQLGQRQQLTWWNLL